jgi:hypothetical protein
LASTQRVPCLRRHAVATYAMASAAHIPGPRHCCCWALAAPIACVACIRSITLAGTNQKQARSCQRLMRCPWHFHRAMCAPADGKPLVAPSHHHRFWPHISVGLAAGTTHCIIVPSKGKPIATMCSDLCMPAAQSWMGRWRACPAPHAGPTWHVDPLQAMRRARLKYMAPQPKASLSKHAGAAAARHSASRGMRSVVPSTLMPPRAPMVRAPP